MDKNEFMRRLTVKLQSLPDDERIAAQRYYEEYFADAGPENEQQVIAELELPEQIANRILAEYRDVALHDPEKQSGEGAEKETADQTQKKEKGRRPIWLIALIVLIALPIIGPIALGIFGIAFGVFAALVGIWLALAIVGLVAAVTGFCVCIGGIITLFTNVAGGVLTIGGGLLTFGIGILLVSLIIWLSFEVLVPLFCWTINKVRRLFRLGGSTV